MPVLPQETLRRSIGTTNVDTPSARIDSPFNLKWFGDDLSVAYAALPVGGGEIFLGGDITLDASLILTITKPLILNLNGFSITLSHPTGKGLSLVSAYSVRTTPIQIKNGVIRDGAPGASRIGLFMLYSLYATISNVRFLDFSGAGSTGVLWDFVEDSSMGSCVFTNNATALELTNATNDNRFQKCDFMENSRALLIHGLSVTPGVIVGGGSDLNTFSSCLFQHNSGVHTIDIIADTSAGPYLNTWANCWFELNGDGTGNSREFYIQADAPNGAFAQNFFVCNFSPMDAAAGVQTFEFSGTGEYRYNNFFGTSFSIDPTGLTGVGFTVQIGAGVVAAPHIKFPAVQEPSADPNILDDYEEGTSVVALVPQTSGTITMNNATLKWTKVGRKVSFTGLINVASVAAPLGDLFLTGLPFPNGAAFSNRAGVAIFAENLNAVSSVIGLVLEGSSTIILRRYNNGTVTLDLASGVQASSGFTISGVYFTD